MQYAKPAFWFSPLLKFLVFPFRALRGECVESLVSSYYESEGRSAGTGAAHAAGKRERRMR